MTVIDAYKSAGHSKAIKQFLKIVNIHIYNLLVPVDLTSQQAEAWYNIKVHYIGRAGLLYT